MPFSKHFIALFFVAFSAGNTWANECFGNESLQNIAVRGGNHTGTLIYVWSPRMVLSATQAHLPAQAAQQLGLDFLAVHDARLPAAEVKQALERSQRDAPATAMVLQGSRALCANELVSREALRHFPTAYVITARGMHHLPIVGAMPLNAWMLSIQERLKP